MHNPNVLLFPGKFHDRSFSNTTGQLDNNYERNRSATQPIQSTEPDFARKADGSVEIKFQNSSDAITSNPVFPLNQSTRDHSPSL